jgi:hypothetical protein
MLQVGATGIKPPTETALWLYTGYKFNIKETDFTL